MRPSRTYTIALVGVTALLLLAAALVLCAWIVPAAIGHVAPAIGTIALGVAGVCGAGAGAMGLRDYGSRGLTSSQAEDVLLQTHLQPGPPTHPDAEAFR